MFLKEDAVIYFNLISVSDFLSFMLLYIGSDEAATKDKVRPLFQTLMHKKYNSDCLYISVLLVCMLQPWSCSWVFSTSPLNINFQLLPLTERQVKKIEVNCWKCDTDPTNLSVLISWMGFKSDCPPIHPESFVFF